MELVQHTFNQWKEANKLNITKSRKKLGKGLGRVLDGAALEAMANARLLKDQLVGEGKCTGR